MPDQQPLVSVIVPNYNYAKSLPLCLKAIQDQDYPSIEIVLIDDCSTDDSVVVAAALGVEAVSTGTNGGVSVARNLGAARARGEILLFVDSDVALAPDAVTQAVRLLLATPDLGAVCGIYDPDPLIRDSRMEEYRCLQQYYALVSSEGRISTVHTNTFAIRADVFAELDGFNPQLRHTEDQDFGLRLAMRYGALSTSAVVGRHDNDDTLRLVLRKVYQRIYLAMPLYLRRRGLPGGYASGPRAWASAVCLLSVATLLLPLLLGAAWAVVPVLVLGTGLACDTGLYRCVVRHKGWGFLGYFMAVNFVVNLTVAVGVIAGGLRCLFSRRFREVYDAALGSGVSAPA
ncbi:glycosyltransferase family A protein [Streptomyces sp. NPDC050997]|uniref:glycosyltransferase family 2 protein n=1 Tax=Streptomyces sp. NPDC050997 TaxID=3155519 RepID=UPI00341DE920